MGLREGGQGHYRLEGTDDSSGMTSAIQESRPDMIFHLAGLASSEHPAALYNVNVVYAAELLNATEQAHKKGTPILLVGTAAEYGLVVKKDLPVREDHPPRPYNHHGISKLAQTLLALAQAQAGHRLVVVRPGNIIGSGMPPHLLLGRMVKEIERIANHEKEARIDVGNLDSARDFVDIDDVVEVYWNLIRNPKAYGEVVNVCSGEATPVRTVVERLIALSGVRVELVSQPGLRKTHDPAVYCGSVSKLGGLVERVPRFELDKTLKSILSSTALQQ